MQYKRFNGMIGAVFAPALAALFGAALLMAACDNGASPSNPPPPEPNPPYAGQAIQKVEFAAGEASKTVTIEGLAGQSVFLVKVNMSPETVNMLATGGVLPSPEDALDEVNYVTPSFGNSKNPYTALPGGELLRSRGARDLPPFPALLSPEAVSPRPSSPMLSQTAALLRAFVAPAVEDERQFWVYKDQSRTTQKQITAHLRAVSEYCNVWVDDEWFDESSADSADGKLRTAQIQVLAAKFDEIYRYETAIFGHEYGGDPTDAEYEEGGTDGDPKIHILVQDIGYDFGYDFPINDSAAGYFAYRDYFFQDELNDMGWNYKSNEAEIFYLDAPGIDAYPDHALSILVHEFQHMIYFNENTIQKNLDWARANNWYNEMLSLLAEDLISPLIGITTETPGHPVQFYILSFLVYYRLGLYKLPWDDTRYAYETLYPFGAYLVRNFGGVDLLMEMARNDYTGYASISAALDKLNPGMTFEKALSRYGEALIYSGKHKPEGALTFDRTASGTVDGMTYTFHGFDIWKMANPYAGLENIPLGYCGPVIFNQRAMDYTKNNIYPHSLALQSQNDWQRVYGDLAIELQKPNSPDIEMYLMVR